MSAVHDTLSRAPVLTALEADFRRNRWTFELPPHPVGPGEWLVVRASELRQALAADETDTAEVVHLRRMRGGHASFISLGGDQALEVQGDAGSAVTLYRDHTPRSDASSWHPAYWWGIEQRVDAQGRKWSRHLRNLVTDDFGTLVEVAE